MHSKLIFVIFIRRSIVEVIPQMGGRVELGVLKYSTCHLESIGTPFAHIMTSHDSFAAVFILKSDQNTNFDLQKLGHPSFSKLSFPTQTGSRHM